MDGTSSGGGNGNEGKRGDYAAAAEAARERGVVAQLHARMVRFEARLHAEIETRRRWKQLNKARSRPAQEQEAPLRYNDPALIRYGALALLVEPVDARLFTICFVLFCRFSFARGACPLLFNSDKNGDMSD